MSISAIYLTLLLRLIQLSQLYAVNFNLVCCEELNYLTQIANLAAHRSYLKQHESACFISSELLFMFPAQLTFALRCQWASAAMVRSWL